MRTPHSQPLFGVLFCGFLFGGSLGLSLTPTDTSLKPSLSANILKSDDLHNAQKLSNLGNIPSTSPDGFGEPLGNLKDIGTINNVKEAVEEDIKLNKTSENVKEQTIVIKEAEDGLSEILKNKAQDMKKKYKKESSDNFEEKLGKYNVKNSTETPDDKKSTINYNSELVESISVNEPKKNDTKKPKLLSNVKIGDTKILSPENYNYGRHIDFAKNTVPVLNWGGPTNPTLRVDKSGIDDENSKNSTAKGKYFRSHTTIVPDLSTIVKNLSLRNKLRLNPTLRTRTLPISYTEPSYASQTEFIYNDESEHVSIKPFTTRKRPSRLSYLSTSPDFSIPPTATAWALATLKAPESRSKISNPTTEILIVKSPTPTIGEVKPFVPWSTRLQRITEETSQKFSTLGVTESLPTPGIHEISSGYINTDMLDHPVISSNRKTLIEGTDVLEINNTHSEKKSVDHNVENIILSRTALSSTHITNASEEFHNAEKTSAPLNTAYKSTVEVSENEHVKTTESNDLNFAKEKPQTEHNDDIPDYNKIELLTNDSFSNISKALTPSNEQVLINSSNKIESKDTLKELQSSTEHDYSHPYLQNSSDIVLDPNVISENDQFKIKNNKSLTDTQLERVVEKMSLPKNESVIEHSSPSMTDEKENLFYTVLFTQFLATTEPSKNKDTTTTITKKPFILLRDNLESPIGKPNNTYVKLVNSKENTSTKNLTYNTDIEQNSQHIKEELTPESSIKEDLNLRSNISLLPHFDQTTIPKSNVSSFSTTPAVGLLENIINNSELIKPNVTYFGDKRNIQSFSSSSVTTEQSHDSFRDEHLNINYSASLNSSLNNNVSLPIKSVNNLDSILRNMSDEHTDIVKSHNIPNYTTENNTTNIAVTDVQVDFTSTEKYFDSLQTPMSKNYTNSSNDLNLTNNNINVKDNISEVTRQQNEIAYVTENVEKSFEINNVDNTTVPTTIESTLATSKYDMDYTTVSSQNLGTDNVTLSESVSTPFPNNFNVTINSSNTHDSEISTTPLEDITEYTTVTSQFTVENNFHENLTESPNQDEVQTLKNPTGIDDVSIKEWTTTPLYNNVTGLKYEFENQTELTTNFREEDSSNDDSNETDENLENTPERGLHDVLFNRSDINVSNNSTEKLETISVTVTTPKIIETTTVTGDEFVTSSNEENISDSSYVQLLVQTSYQNMCNTKEKLKNSIIKLLNLEEARNVSKKQVVILLMHGECGFETSTKTDIVPVKVVFTDTNGCYDKTLTDTFISLWRQGQLIFDFPITQVKKMEADDNLDMDTQGMGSMVAAIVISSVAGICLLFLTILLVVMRKRQKGFNYGQRCTPVSLEDYSLDNISVYNSIRRKAIRASKRSYGNPAFDDPGAISHVLNFAGLANFGSDRSRLDEEFVQIPSINVKPDELPPDAETKNRYANVIPIPETRVPLKIKPGFVLLDQYINANYVKGLKGAEKFYIACQAPLQNTVNDFWQMIWEQQSRMIIMLTDLHENGVEKCVDYLPPSEVLDCHRVFGDLQVTLRKREVREKYIISSLQLKNLESNLWREITHMWYVSWPYQGVPDEPSAVIALLIEARSYIKGKEHEAPIVVHCSPGTGRTGAVIAIDMCIRDFESNRTVDIPKCVYNIRKDRAGSVQTKDQYAFIYQVLHLYATKLTGGGLDSI